MSAPRAVDLDAAGGVAPSDAVRAAMAGAAGLWAYETGGHDAAARTEDAVEAARADVAALIGADPADVVFTSSPAESRVTAVRGLRDASPGLGSHAVASALEHPAVTWALRRAEAGGNPWTACDVRADGLLDPAAVGAAVRDDTALVCVHHGQEDVGAVNDVAALVAAARDRRPEARVHVDACATAGLVPVDVAAWDADAVSLGGPALGCPGGVAALWVRPGARLVPLVGGTLQQDGRRAGSLNVPGVAGMGAAAREAREGMGDDARRRTALAQRLWAGLDALGDVRLNGPPVARRIPGNVQASVGGVTGETLAVTLAAHGVAVSPGSACSALAGKASPVLEAMGVDAPWSLGSVLFTVGPRATEDDVDEALARIADVVGRLRAQSLSRP